MMKEMLTGVGRQGQGQKGQDVSSLWVLRMETTISVEIQQANIFKQESRKGSVDDSQRNEENVAKRKGE